MLSGFAKVSFLLGSQLAFFTAWRLLYHFGCVCGICWSAGAFELDSLCDDIFWYDALLFSSISYSGSFCLLLLGNYSRVIRWRRQSGVLSWVFLLHPVGGQAALYSLFWLIPAALMLFEKETLFTRALGSTFTPMRLVRLSGFIRCR